MTKRQTFPCYALCQAKRHEYVPRFSSRSIKEKSRDKDTSGTQWHTTARCVQRRGGNVGSRSRRVFAYGKYTNDAINFPRRRRHRSVGRSSQRLRGQSIVDAKRAPTPFRVPRINGSYEPCTTRHAPETNTTRIGALSVSVFALFSFH